MPADDRTTEMSEMRNDLDTVSGETAENVSEMQESGMDETQEYQSLPMTESVQYRVRMYDEDEVPYSYKDNSTVLFLDYFSDYEYANQTFDAICEDADFVKARAHFLSVELQKAYRGFGEIFWETIRKSTIYDDSKKE